MSDPLAYQLSDYDGHHSISIGRLKSLHHEHGLSLRELSTRFNTTAEAISVRLKKAGIDRLCGACGDVMSGVREDTNYCSPECKTIDTGGAVVCPFCEESVSEIGRWVAHRDKEFGRRSLLSTPAEYEGGRVSWDAQRQEALRRANNSCEICGETSDLDVHHVVKRRFFDEEDRSHALSNLCVICRGCHAKYENSGGRELYQLIENDARDEEADRE